MFNIYGLLHVETCWSLGREDLENERQKIVTETMPDWQRTQGTTVGVFIYTYAKLVSGDAMTNSQN